MKVDRECVRRMRQLSSHEALTMVGVLVVIGFVVLLVAPCFVAASIDLDEEDTD